MCAETVIAIDAAGGDRGPGAVVGGLTKAARACGDVRFILHGDEAELTRLLRRRGAARERAEIRHAEKVIAMREKPSVALRHARGTSMMGAIDSVAAGEASVAVSCGNTGALMALSMLKLKRAPGVDRPAIAVMWPSRARSGYTIVLDMGADVRADPRNLAEYAVMGAEYARVSFDLETPKLGLLNVGSEDNKGRPGIRQAGALIGDVAASVGGFEFLGYVEGGEITNGAADVVVTDGFTGNVALKTAEGTAAFIRESLDQAFRHTPLSRLAALMAATSLRRLQKKIDPRRVNGGVFLGLGGTVVKSHGGADATGVAAAVRLACRMGRTGFARRVSDRVALLPDGRDYISTGTE